MPLPARRTQPTESHEPRALPAHRAGNLSRRGPQPVDGIHRCSHRSLLRRDRHRPSAGSSRRRGHSPLGQLSWNPDPVREHGAHADARAHPRARARAGGTAASRRGPRPGDARDGRPRRSTPGRDRSGGTRRTRPGTPGSAARETTPLAARSDENLRGHGEETNLRVAQAPFSIARAGPRLRAVTRGLTLFRNAGGGDLHRRRDPVHFRASHQGRRVQADSDADVATVDATGIPRRIWAAINNRPRPTGFGARVIRHIVGSASQRPALTSSTNTESTCCSAICTRDFDQRAAGARRGERVLTEGWTDPDHRVRRGHHSRRVRACDLGPCDASALRELMRLVPVLMQLPRSEELREASKLGRSPSGS